MKRTQIVCIRIVYDDRTHDEPADWNWPDIATFDWDDLDVDIVSWRPVT